MKQYAVAINPVQFVKDCAPTDFKLVSLENPIQESLLAALNSRGEATNASPLGSIVVDGKDGKIEVGMFVDPEAEIHGEMVKGERQPARLNSFATLIRRAALGAQGDNPIGVAPVAGRVIVCRINDERDPMPMTEADGYILITQLAELLGNGYIGDERFDQRFLNWMSEQEVQTSVVKMAKEISRLGKLAKKDRDNAPVTLGDMPYPSSDQPKKKEWTN